jgi:peptide/nickel transport system substrate-binding protein
LDPASGAAGPGLASSWQASADGAAWTFALRGGITFQDGAALDAATVVASFERGRASPAYRSLFDGGAAIAKISAVDARTVRFDLRAPFGPFLAHLAAPQTAIARGAAGSGPFIATGVAPDGTLTLRRNDTYWRRTADGRTLPFLDALVIRPVRDASARLVELRTGRADVAIDLPVAQEAAARSDPNLVLTPRRSAALASLGIDVAQAPFDRVEVRRAIALAVDRSALGGAYGGSIRPAAQVVPAGTLGFDESVLEFAPLDVTAAKRVMADAHVPTPLAADLAYPAVPTVAYPDPQRAAQSIAADLGKIGIAVRLRGADPGALRDEKAALTLDTTPLGLDPDDVFWPLFGSDDPQSVSLAVGLLRRARGEIDVTKRAELYKQVSKLTRADVPRVPLVFADRASASSARVAALADASASFVTVWLRP